MGRPRARAYLRGKGKGGEGRWSHGEGIVREGEEGRRGAVVWEWIGTSRDGGDRDEGQLLLLVRRYFRNTLLILAIEPKKHVGCIRTPISRNE
jgi:hypothetical protein